MGESDATGRTTWFDDPMTRRAVFGLLGLTALTIACSDDSGASPSSVAGTTTTPPVTPGTSTPTTTILSTATTALSAPSTTPSSTTILPGSNAYVTVEVLSRDAEGYGGNWGGSWSFDDGSASGTISATVVFDVAARTVSGRLTVDGPMLDVPVPEMTASGSVDSYIYDDVDAAFDITVPTAAGEWRVTGDGGFGRFKVHIDVATGGATAFDAKGVANRPSLIPLTFTLTFADATTKTGTIQLTPA